VPSAGSGPFDGIVDAFPRNKGRFRESPQAYRESPHRLLKAARLTFMELVGLLSEACLGAESSCEALI
jgi:hypothetical protein